MSAAAPSIVWFRRELRLVAQPALAAAAASGAPLLPVYIILPELAGPWAPGPATRAWLRASLAALGDALAALGVPLCLRPGPPAEALRALALEAGARELHAVAGTTPAERQADLAVEAALTAAGVAVTFHDGTLLHAPPTLRTGTGAPYRVFTPFWRALQQLPTPAAPPGALPALRPVVPPPAPQALPAATPAERAAAAGLRAAGYTPGEAGAEAALQAFLAGPLAGYAADRDRPDRSATSRLSAHLHFGELSVQRVAATVRAAFAERGAAAAGTPEFLRQLGWREFAHHLLWHFPETGEAPLKPAFAHFPWAPDRALQAAWQAGETGYPLVDAGIRELVTSGFLHNRVRMVVASFLVKQLLQPWQAGARFFFERLADADLANNTLGWQWVAGCGADAQPFFRIFNPLRQAERFDPQGRYVRRWLPELAALPDRYVHAPHEAPPAVLRGAGLQLDRDYPRPIVDHAFARQRALAAYAALINYR